MNLYDVRAHVLRSETVKALQPEQVVALAQAAEDALGLTGTSYTGSLAVRAATAVVRQVNRMAAEPADPYLSSHTMGEESKAWETRSAGVSAASLDPIAVLIVDALAEEAAEEAEDFTIVPGYR